MVLAAEMLAVSVTRVMPTAMAATTLKMTMTAIVTMKLMVIIKEFKKS